MLSKVNSLFSMYRAPRSKCLSLLHIIKPKIKLQLHQIHARLIINGLQSPTSLAKLIEQYCRISQTHDAELIFTRSIFPSLYLFNTLVRCTPPQQSIGIFANWASKNEFAFDQYSYVYVIGSCARLCSVSTLWFGKQVHARALNLGLLVSSVLLQTTLIHFYGCNKDVDSCRTVFDEMSERNVVTWNAMIRGYCLQNGEYGRMGLFLFRDMLVGDCRIRPTGTTMVCVLSACAQLGALETGACVHGYVEKAICVPDHDVFIGTGLVDMYAKCGCLDTALRVFSRMSVKDVLTWTAMATGLAVHGKGKETLQFLDSMVTYGVRPNAVTFTSLLSACCHSGLVEEGLHLFCSMQSKFGIEPDIQHYGCIVDLLGKAGHVKVAFEFVTQMPVKRDAVLWRSLLSACQLHGDIELGEKVGKMLLETQQVNGPQDGISTGEDFVALSNIYASVARWEDVEIVRKEMKANKVETMAGASLIQAFGNRVLEK